MSDKKTLDAFFKGYSDVEDVLEYRIASSIVGEKVDTISTGSPSLDDALSSGGLPRGRIIQFYGAPGSGKTLMSMVAIVEAQKQSKTAKQVFIDAEGTFDPNWAQILGVDTSRVILIEGELAVNGRRCFEMLLGVPKEDSKHVLIGKSKQGLLDKIADKTIDVNLIILDSLGSIQPPGEDTSAVGKMNMSLLARFLTTAMRKLSLEVKKANVVMVIINHKKDQMNAYASLDHTFSGGNTYTHFLSANIYFEAIQRKDAQILNDKEQKIGHIMRGKIEKSKFGNWPRQCEFKIDFSKGIIDKHEEIAQLAVDYDIIEKPSSVTHQYKDMKWVGFNNFVAALAENSDLCNELATKVNEARDSVLDRMRKEQQEKIEETEDQPKRKKKENNI